jgi:ABC-2 type transport system permease protein
VKENKFGFILEKIGLKNVNLQKLNEPGKERPSIFWAIVRKEFTDYITSWRIIILLIIIALTCIGSLYTVLTTIRDAVSQSEEAQTIGRESFLFLKLFTVSDGTLPPFVTFITFLGPLLGIALGFDAINSERNRGTLSRLMSQPISRDYVLNAKFTAALLVNIVLFFSLGFLVMGLGIFILGIPPTFEEFWRIILYLILSVAYVAFWLNLGILFSVKFRQAATSALAGIAVWLFFSIFYSMIISIIQKALMTGNGINQVQSGMANQSFVLFLSRLSPNYLFSESTMTLLTPSVRTLGPITTEQKVGAIASPLPLDQSLILIWPQLTGLIAATMICFALSYVFFMRQEIRS